MPVSRRLPRTAAFWSVAVLLVLMLAASGVPSPLYRVYQEEFGFGSGVLTTIFGIYALTYGAKTVGLSQSSLLWMIIAANLVALVTIPTWAIVGDRIGRKPVFLVGALGSAALIWPFIWAISSGDILLVFVFGILLSGVVYPAAAFVHWASGRTLELNLEPSMGASDFAESRQGPASHLVPAWVDEVLGDGGPNSS